MAIGNHIGANLDEKELRVVVMMTSPCKYIANGLWLALSTLQRRMVIEYNLLVFLIVTIIYSCELCIYSELFLMEKKKRKINTVGMRMPSMN